MPDNTTTPTTPPETNGNPEFGRAVIAAGREQLGVPYVLGGAGDSSGTDCGMFTMTTFAKLGVDLTNRCADVQAAWCCNQGLFFTNQDCAVPGDLIFFHNTYGDYPPGDITHVAIYEGDDRILQASSKGVNEDACIHGGYWLDYLSGFGRVPGNGPLPSNAQAAATGTYGPSSPGGGTTGTQSSLKGFTIKSSGATVTISANPSGKTMCEPIHPDMIAITGKVPKAVVSATNAAASTQKKGKSAVDGTVEMTMADLEDQYGVDLSGFFGDAEEMKKRNEIFDITKHMDSIKAPNTGKPINNTDAYPVDLKIEELETHQPRFKIDKMTLTKPSAVDVYIAQTLMAVADRAEKRIVKLENMMSTLERYMFGVGSRMHVNCVYYGGQDKYQKYKCIRCLHSDLVEDGQSMQIDQCLTCTRYEPIIGQVYDIQDSVGTSLGMVLDDLQAAYMTMDDYKQFTRTESFHTEKTQATFDTTKLNTYSGTNVAPAAVPSGEAELKALVEAMSKSTGKKSATADKDAAKAYTDAVAAGKADNVKPVQESMLDQATKSDDNNVKKAYKAYSAAAAVPAVTPPPNAFNWKKGVVMDWKLTPVEQQKPLINWRQDINDDDKPKKHLASFQEAAQPLGGSMAGAGCIGGSTTLNAGNMSGYMKTNHAAMQACTDPTIRAVIDAADEHAKGQVNNVLSNMAQYGYESIIKKVANDTGVDPLMILAIISQETGGDPNSAIGLMQTDATTYDSSDLEGMIRGGVNVYIAKAEAMGTNNPVYVLCAYNWGQGIAGNISAVDKETDTWVQVFSSLNSAAENAYPGQPHRTEYFADICFEYIYLQGQSSLTPLDNKSGAYGTLRFPFAQEDLINVTYSKEFGATSDEAGNTIPTHNGVNLQAAVGTRVYCICNGAVTNTGTDICGEGSGECVVVTHDNGLISEYWHLNDISVENGTQVTTESQLGHVGQTGKVSASHLQLSIKEKEKYVDPQTFFPSLAGKLGQKLQDMTTTG